MSPPYLFATRSVCDKAGPDEVYEIELDWDGGLLHIGDARVTARGEVVERDVVMLPGSRLRWLRDALTELIDGLGGAALTGQDDSETRDESAESAESMNARASAYAQVVQAAAELLPLVGEIDPDGDFVPLPHPSLSMRERERIAPYLEEPWHVLSEALAAANVAIPAAALPVLVEDAAS